MDAVATAVDKISDQEALSFALSSVDITPTDFRSGQVFQCDEGTVVYLPLGESLLIRNTR